MTNYALVSLTGMLPGLGPIEDKELGLGKPGNKLPGLSA